MTVAIGVVLGLAVVTGLLVGTLGGGGSVLTIPILTYVAGMEAKPAIATSLLVVALTSSAGAINHARAGRVQWRTALVFGGGGVLGAVGGGRVAEHIPGDILLILFAVVMAVSAIAMLRGRSALVTPAASAHPHVKLALQGVAVGAVTGLVGAGGGFMIVPALVLLARLPMNVAVGTSLVIIAGNSFAGLAGHHGHVDIPWRLALAIAGCAITGSVAGSHLAGRVKPEQLRLGFGCFVLAVAAFILIQQLA